MPEQPDDWKPVNHPSDCGCIACTQRRLSNWKPIKQPHPEPSRSPPPKRRKRSRWRRWRRRLRRRPKQQPVHSVQPFRVKTRRPRPSTTPRRSTTTGRSNPGCLYRLIVGKLVGAGIMLAVLFGGAALSWVVEGISGLDVSKENQPAATNQSVSLRYPNGEPLDKPTIEEWVIFYTNEERKAAGLVVLTHDPSISDISRSHSEKMIQFGYSHTVQGMNPTNRATAAGYNCRVYQADGSISYGVSENITKHPRITKWSGTQYQAVYRLITFAGDSQAMARNLVDAWMESPGHRANLMHAEARSIGVGVAILESQQYGWTQETVYATQNFSRCD